VDAVTASGSVPAERLQQPGEILRLWIGFLTGPLIALAEQEVEYLLVPGACASGHELPLHATALVALLLIAGSGLVARREFHRAGPVPDESGGPRARSRFMAAVGMLTSIIFGLGVAAHWLAVIILGACHRAV
jgi:hypothetical protein